MKITPEEETRIFFFPLILLNLRTFKQFDVFSYSIPVRTYLDFISTMRLNAALSNKQQ